MLTDNGSLFSSWLIWLINLPSLGLSFAILVMIYFMVWGWAEHGLRLIQLESVYLFFECNWKLTDIQQFFACCDINLMLVRTKWHNIDIKVKWRMVRLRFSRKGIKRLNVNAVLLIAFNNEKVSWESNLQSKAKCFDPYYFLINFQVIVEQDSLQIEKFSFFVQNCWCISFFHKFSFFFFSFFVF